MYISMKVFYMKADENTGQYKYSIYFKNNYENIKLT